MDIDEIVRTLNKVIEGVFKSPRDRECVKDSVEEHHKLWRIARKPPIVSQVLSETAENIQYDYIAGLLYLSELNHGEHMKTQQRLYL